MRKIHMHEWTALHYFLIKNKIKNIQLTCLINERVFFDEKIGRKIVNEQF